jgi:diguanylate cyclase (GGDEF)-like protein/PAS domain S-box-containing protein
MSEHGHRHGWLLIAAASLTIALALRAGGALVRLDWAIGDVYARWLRHEVTSDIVIIGIDERSLAELHKWPWRRGIHARLLDRLLPLHPRHVFLDIDFSAESDTQEDALLAQALARWAPATVILPAFQQVGSSDEDELQLTQPLPAFRQHVTLGSVNVTPSRDSLIRDIDSVWAPPGMAALPAAFSLFSARQLPYGKLTIDYSISPASFQFLSYSDVLQGRIDRSALAGKTLIVGATAIELGDMQPVPVFRSLPGIVVQSLAAQTARSGMLRTPGPLLGMCLLGLWAILVGAGLRGDSWRRNGLIACAMILLVMAVTLGARYRHVQLEVAPYLIIVGLSFLMGTLRSLDMQTLRGLRLTRLVSRRNALLRSIVESSADCILCVDAAGRIVSVNPAAERLLGGEPARLLRRSLLQLLRPSNETAQGADLQALKGRISEQLVCSLGGSLVPVEMSVTPVHLQDETLHTVLLRDLSERKAQEERLLHQATHDSLTGLPNRHALRLELRARIDSCRSSGHAFCLYMLDLTRFKEVNDTLGHNLGDLVLCEVALRFQRVLGDRGYIARMGGDEFVILARAQLLQEQLIELAQALADTLKTPILCDGTPVEVGVSIGMAGYPHDASDADELLKNADIAMYSAKRQKAVYAFYRAGENEHSLRRLQMLGDLRSALTQRLLELRFQPQVNLRTGRAESVEALLRWQHPSYGFVSPLEVVPLAEATDLLRPLTDWTITAALSQARAWELEGLRTRVAVNLSAHMLRDVSLPGRLAQLLSQQEVLPDMLELEITEGAMMFDAARALNIVKGIRELGVQVSVDDYGTGFSSLAYLRDLSVHALKLDRSFVSDLESNPGSRIIVKSTVALAHALQLHMVAEGVETLWQAEFLRAHGCDYAQGYYYAKALSGSECADWLRRQNAVAASIPAARGIGHHHASEAAERAQVG